MNQEEIKKILPHRDNMLLLDEVVQDGDTAIGSLRITGDEWFLKGHFPGAPVVPGVILCEILAQSVCVLLKDEMADGKLPGRLPGRLPYYTGMNRVKFRNPVHPGDTFVTHCRITKSKGPFYWAEGQGYVGEKLCVQGEFSFAIVDV